MEGYIKENFTGIRLVSDKERSSERFSIGKYEDERRKLYIIPEECYIFLEWDSSCLRSIIANLHSGYITWNEAEL